MLSVKASRAARFLLLKWHRKDQRKRREGREGGREEKEGDRKQGKDWRGVLGHGHYRESRQEAFTYRDDFSKFLPSLPL